MKKIILIISILCSSNLCFAEPWIDISDASLKQNGETLFLDKDIDQLKNHRVLVNYKKGFLNNPSYTLNHAIINCQNKSFYFLGGQIYIRNIITNKGVPASKESKEIAKSSTEDLIFNEVCK